MFPSEKIAVYLWMQVAVAVSNMEKDDCETFWAGGGASLQV